MNEGHQRFQDWLTAGAEGDPPRDLAVHASVCAACQQSIAALDELALVNTGLASMPGTPTGRERSRLVLAGRLVGATAVLFSAALLGVGASQLIGVARPGGEVAQATATPSADQGVLGQTATPQPSPSGEATPSVTQETLTPLATPGPTHLGPPSATPWPIWQPTPRPIATPISTPTLSPSATASASASASESPSASATESTPPLPQCSDGIDNDFDGFTDSVGLDPGCTDPSDNDETDPQPSVGP